MTCSEIVKNLEQEKGTDSCGNCHSVISYNHSKNYKNEFLEKIFTDNSHLVKVIEDISRTNEKIRNLFFNSSIKNPLKRKIMIKENFIKYLNAIFELSQLGDKVTPNRIKNYIGVHRSAVLQFFREKVSFIEQYINIEDGIQGNLSNTIEYSLTDFGKKTVKLLSHFKDYYKSL